MNFMEKLQMTLMDNKKQTENGAVGYETTGSALVDLNFAVASLRNEREDRIIKRFLRAFHEDRVLAMKWLFFLRDVRGGLGERRTFRIIIRHLAISYTDMVKQLVKLMAEYGRYDDLLCLFYTPVEREVLAYIAGQIKEDILNMEAGNKVSLCAKWMPSCNTSSEESKEMAYKLIKYMQLTAAQYRKMLAKLRAYLKVTECYMSDNRWEEIDYSKVPSKANVLYRNAFMKHDEARREAFLQAVERNEAQIQAGTLMPHEIVTRYTKRNGWQLQVGLKDASLEALWNNLPNTLKGAENVLCVVDGSGSMLCPVGNTGTTALHVSNALGIYFAERMQGAYHNKYITFSNTPKYVDLSSCTTLREKLELAFAHNDCTNTNIEATFNLILKTADQNCLKQSELPQTVLIISDMEFDQATYGLNTEPLFKMISKKFAIYGYKMPKLVFWNVNSRTDVIPVRENELGVGLVSGFSVNICQMVLSNELSSYRALKKVLDSPRYQVIEKYVS